MIQPKASRIWMSFDFSLDVFATVCTEPNINKVTSNRYSVVSIDGCPLGTVYFVYHNDWLFMIKILVLRVIRPR